MTEPVRLLLSGGIGSGKSTAARILAYYGAEVLSADAAARQVVAPGGPAHSGVAAAFPEVVGPDGRIDRAALADRVFRDPAALRRLEAITHPAVEALLAARVAASEATVVVVEVPLLVDLFGPGWRRVVVSAPEETRLHRLLGRGMDEEDARRRLAAQPRDEEWRQAADHLIRNDGTLADLEGECRRLWEEVTGAPPSAATITR